MQELVQQKQMVVGQFLLQADELTSQLLAQAADKGQAHPAAPQSKDGIFHGMLLRETRVSCSPISACFNVF